jgi:hypothetical protein
LLDVATVVQRQRGLVFRVAFAIRVASIFVLTLRRVEQNDFRQFMRRRRAINRSLVALLHNARQIPDVIEVRVREHDGVERANVERRGRPVPLAKLFETLE